MEGHWKQYFKLLPRNHNKNALLFTQFVLFYFKNVYFFHIYKLQIQKNLFSTKIPNPPQNKGHSRFTIFSSIS